jgi:hypothetical protein
MPSWPATFDLGMEPPKSELAGEQLLIKTLLIEITMLMIG